MKKVLSLLLVCIMVLSLGSAAFAASGKWQVYNGEIYYQLADGSYAVNSWQKIDGNYYHFDGNGRMQKDVQKIGGKYYYFGLNGILKFGVQLIGRNYYYFGADGAMVFGWQKIGSKYYYFGSNGAMVFDWQKIGGRDYYFNTDGSFAIGWVSYGGKWYLMQSDGSMLVGLIGFNGKYYLLGMDGAMRTGFLEYYGDYYYFTADGSAYVGWLQYGSDWYYFKEDGAMAANESVAGYKFAANGKCIGKADQQSSSPTLSIVYNDGPQITGLNLYENEVTIPDGTKQSMVMINGSYVNNTTIYCSLIAATSSSPVGEEDVRFYIQDCLPRWKQEGVYVDDMPETMFGFGFQNGSYYQAVSVLYIVVLQMDQNFNYKSCVIYKITK